MGQNLTDNIPHRPPMHWLDNATRETDGTVVAIRKLSDDQPFMMDGLLPRTALLEIAAQAAACAAARGQTGAPPQPGVLAALRNVHFFSTPRSGQTIAIRVRVVRSLGTLFLCTIEATTDGRPVLTGDFYFALHRDSTHTALESHSRTGNTDNN